MWLKINEHSGEEFYRECVNVMMQYPQLLKDHGAKLSDLFTVQTTIFFASAVIFIAVNVLGLMWGYKASVIVALVLLGFSVVRSLVSRKGLYDMLRSLMSEERAQILSLDKEAITLKIEGADHSARVPWENIAFARVFDKSVCFFADSSKHVVFTVDREYEDQVLNWIDVEKPELELIE